MDKRVSQFREIFKRFLGVFVLIVLFAIAELAPDINAEGANPLVGKWNGRLAGSATEHLLRLEADRSYTWDSNGMLVMSGEWEEVPNGLKLKFGSEDSDFLIYQTQLLNGELTLTNDVGSYKFSRQPSE